LLSIKRLVLATLFTGSVINCGFARDLDPELRQTVIASCSQDAYRLCPQSLGNEHDAVNCMKSKRAQLDHTCRVAYDKVARVLAQ
jgi:hypothetical protein